MLLVTSPPSVICGHYPRATCNSLKLPNTDWSLLKERPTTKVKTKRKRVHFADTKGLPLTTTLFFVKDDEEFSPRQPGDNRRQIFANFYKSNAKGDTNRTTRGHAKLLNFKSPIPSTNHQECLQRNNVCLEKTLCIKAGVYGRIQVKNLDYEKEVFVRYSWDSWKTFVDTHANYMLGGSTVESDTFFFRIKTPHEEEIEDDRKVEFAICYKVNQGAYWDNNFGDNYRLIYFLS